MRSAPFVLILLAGALAASTAGAQTLEDRLRTQLVAVTAQLRQAQAAATDAGAEATAAGRERDAVKAQLAKAQAELRSVRRQPAPTPRAALARDDAAAQALRAASERDEADAQALRTENGRLSRQAQERQGEQERLVSARSAAEQGLQACRTKNAEALALARDILAAYDRVGFAGVVARKEPLSQLERVKIERLEQDYADRLYDDRLDAGPRTSANSPAPAAPPPSRP